MYIFLILSTLLVTSCWQDDGLVKPGDPSDPLATFRGTGVDLATSDSTIDRGQRLLDIRNPGIALVWQFVGPKQFLTAPSSAVVNPLSPYDFVVELRDPPAREVLENPDLAIGQFWLYCDRDLNGRLDRLMHPDMVPIQAAIDSLYQAELTALEEMKSLAVILEKPVLVRDTFYVGTYGTVTIRQGNREDTLYAGSPGTDPTLGPNSVPVGRFRSLAAHNKWERFFALRKRDNEYHTTIRPAPGYAYSIEISYHRAVFPRPGRETAFEALNRKAIDAHRAYVLGAQALLRKAVQAGYDDYPYIEDKAGGRDFVVARSREHFVLYLKDAAALSDLLRAERTSSFNVRRLDRLAIGYNLVHCDDQYRCEILSRDAGISLDLGSSGEFFSPPASTVKLPVPIQPDRGLPPPLALPGSVLTRFAGVYNGEPYEPIRIAVRDGSLWGEHPQHGLMRLTAFDTLAFATPHRNLQVQFVPDDEGRIQKIFEVRGKQRFVGVRDTSLGLDGLEKRIDALLAPEGIALDQGRASGLAAFRFDYGGDTLRLGYSREGGLEVTVPGLYPQPMHALDSSTLASRNLDLRLVFAADGRGGCPGVTVAFGGRGTFSPTLGYLAKGPRELFPGLPDTLADTLSSHGGSVPDREITLDGKPRFSGPGDSLFLRRGDGWVDSVGGDWAGGYFLARGGDFLLLRIPALGGKAAAVSVVLVPERGAGRGRVRLIAHGGRERDRQEDDLGGGFWVDFDGKPETVTLGPFPVGADPYFIRLGQSATADKPIAYALGGYSVLSE